MRKKRAIRQAFRDAVLRRAGYRCQGPGCAFRSTPDAAGRELDAHHITDRSLLPSGGYVVENGIALCPGCHRKAEVFHATGESLLGWSPADLYAVIGSSYEAARAASEELEGGLGGGVG